MNFLFIFLFLVSLFFSVFESFDFGDLSLDMFYWFFGFVMFVVVLKVVVFGLEGLMLCVVSSVLMLFGSLVILILLLLVVVVVCVCL